VTRCYAWNCGTDIKVKPVAILEIPPVDSAHAAVRAGINALPIELIRAINKPMPTRPSTAKKNPAAVALGKLGGSKGGKARAKNLPAHIRSAIAKKAAQTRWKSVPKKAH